MSLNVMLSKSALPCLMLPMVSSLQALQQTPLIFDAILINNEGSARVMLPRLFEAVLQRKASSSLVTTNC